MRGIIVTTVLTSILLCAPSGRSQAQDVAAPSPGLDAQGFRRAFEVAFDANDLDAIARLVKENATQFVPLFESYTHLWIERTGEAGEREERAMARARAIATAVDEVLEASGLLEVLDAMGGWSDDDREAWRRARTVYAKGRQLKDSFRWQDALEPLGEACETFEQLADSVRLCAAANVLGNCYDSLGQYEKAIERHTRALELYEKIGNPQNIAYSLNNLGLCYRSLGQHEKAIEHHTRALELIEKIGNPRDIAASLNNLGVCYGSLGQYEKAIAHFTRALELREKIGNPHDIAASLSSLGICYCFLGQYQKAIAHHTRALEIDEKIGNPQTIAASLNNLGLCYDSLGQYQKAIAHHTRALEVKEKIGNPPDIASSLNNLGICYDSLGQYEKAIAHHTRALELREKIGNLQDIAMSLNNLGVCYGSLGQYEKAIAHHTRALELREKIGNPQDIAYSLDNLGIFYHATGRRSDALHALEGCVAALERVPRRSFGEEGRAAFTAKWSKVPRRVCSIVHGLEAKDALGRGFPLVEAFLSRTLLENLQERADRVLDGADPELSKERASALNRMVELRVALGKEATKGSLDSAEAERLRAEITRAEVAFQDLEQRLRAKNPKLGELISPRPASLPEAQAVLRAGEALFVFVLGEEQSYVWVLTGKNASLVTLPPERVIRASFDALIAALAPDESGRFKSDPSFVRAARELHRLLLAPLADQVAAASDLILVPTGFLGFLPFEVLLTKDVDDDQAKDIGELPYLLREKTVRYAPSASFLTWCRTQAARREKRRWEKDLCLFGDALYGEAQGASRARMVPELSRLPRLMATRAEVMAIAETRIGEDEDRLFRELKKLGRSGHVAGARFDLYLGGEASRENLLRDLSAYRIVHLALHGLFDEQFTWYSGLVLSGTSDEARVLNLVDIAGLKLDAELVFLSACETAHGTELGSDGIRSTARSFLLAGAKSVVATQWTVQDEAALIVAQEFYQRLLEGRSSAQALREAKIALLQHEVSERGARPLASGTDRDAALQRYAHPSFWAPFILWGR